MQKCFRHAASAIAIRLDEEMCRLMACFGRLLKKEKVKSEQQRPHIMWLPGATSAMPVKVRKCFSARYYRHKPGEKNTFYKR